jgi:DNA-binding protein H-NS
MNNVQKLKNKLNGLIGGKKQEDLKKLEEVIKNLNQENKNRFLQKFKNQKNSLGTILENVQKFKE